MSGWSLEPSAKRDSRTVGVIVAWPGSNGREIVCRERVCMLLLMVVNDSVDLGVARQRSRPLRDQLTTVAMEIPNYQ